MFYLMWIYSLLCSKFFVDVHETIGFYTEVLHT